MVRKDAVCNMMIGEGNYHNISKMVEKYIFAQMIV